MTINEQGMRLTPREVDQVEAELNAEPTAVPELAAAIRAVREGTEQERFVVHELD